MSITDKLEDFLGADCTAIESIASYIEREREAAFKGGYHCQWFKAGRVYIFDPAMKPGDPDGAYAAWLQFAALKREA